ncbi:MAG TPA: delta-60 repeat domain-containing protein [Flavobacteriales bacterium]|nr:delta-60 repeat domain-containing protein [Flavobacteriales bacterium]
MEKFGNSKWIRSFLFTSHRLNAGVSRFRYLNSFLALLIISSRAFGQNELVDLSFNQSGLVITPEGLGNEAQFYSCVIQNDGKIIAAGGTNITISSPSFQGNELLLIRYHSDGVVDSTFGIDGVVRVNLAEAATFARTIRLRPDGKIAVSGTYRLYENNPFYTNYAFMAVYNDDGTPDLTYGINGMSVIIPFEGQAFIPEEMVIQPDGKSIQVGISYYLGQTDLVMARYNTDGTPDVTFGNNGLVIQDYNQQLQTGRCLTLQEDGKILAAGTLIISSDESPATIFRFLPDGQLDPTFADAGIFILNQAPLLAEFFGVEVQPDGKILAAGNNNTNSSNSVFMCIRLDANGNLDNTFSSDGIFRMDELGGLHNDLLWDMKLNSNGKILLAGQGTATPFNDFPSKATLVQLKEDGTLDPTFGTNGLHFTDLTSNDEVCSHVEFQDDGKILLAGIAADTGGYKGSLVRLLPSSTVNMDKLDVQTSLALFPNPLDERAYVNISLKSKGLRSLFLVDFKGQLVETIFLDKAMNCGEHTVPFEVNSKIVPGMYKLVLVSEDQTHSTSIIIK